MDSHIIKAIEEIESDLEMFDDDLEKYEYIIDLGKALPKLNEELKDDSFLVEGCTSKVWLIPGLIEEKIQFKADSNSSIVKGLVSILLNVFNTSTPQEILTFDFKELSRLKLSEIISPTRQNGVYSMIKKIKFYADVYKDKQ